MTTTELPLLWTTVEHRSGGVCLSLRGELSSITAPALDSLLLTLVASPERRLRIDLRAATVLPPAGERVLARWGAEPADPTGTYELKTDGLGWLAG